jgi:LmbE family N-acetylglucosaminyl deacetylase
MSDHSFPQKNHDLLYRLRGLKMAGTILHVGAHPDDEDAGLMNYMSRKYGVQIVYWSATRGEGGQNRIGPYRADALGIYRTWESLNARVIDGGESLFGPFYDFGFSKSGEEALAKWGQTDVIREIVRAIRLVQPQILIGRWGGTLRDGHGHHQAIGRATIAAYEAAGDASQFPELNLMAWQPQKFYLSTGGDWQPGEDSNFGELQPEFEGDGYIRINTGEYEPISGRTYQELGWLTFNSYQTQAMGFIPEQGDFYYYYQLYASQVPVPAKEETFYDGVDPTLTGLSTYPHQGSPQMQAHLSALKESAEQAVNSFRIDDPGATIQHLLDGLGTLHKLQANLPEEPFNADIKEAMGQYLAKKTEDFERLLARCWGLQLDCLSDHAHVTPGQRFQIAVRLWNHRGIALDNVEFALHFSDGWRDCVLSEASTGPNQLVYELEVPLDARLSCPYWLRQPRGQYRYHWDETPFVSEPFGPELVEVACRLTIGEHQITLQQPVVCREAFAGGFRELPLSVVPPISIEPKESVRFLRQQDSQQELDLQVVIRSNNRHGSVRGEFRLELPDGWRVERNNFDILLEKEGDVVTLYLKVFVPPGEAAGQYNLRYVVNTNNRDYDVILKPVRMGSPGLPRLPDASNCIREAFVVEPAALTLHVIAVELMTNLNYAYVRGADEEVVEVFQQLGVTFDILSDDDMTYAELSEYDAIVIGPNAYLIRHALARNSTRFLDYVRNGGTLIVQYQGYGYQGRGFTPYPFEYNQPHDRVTWENAPVAVINFDHPVATQPNAIIDPDFEGWVHDRGLYFFGKWDKAYKPILACNDIDEDPRLGGLLVTNYGKGTYVYNGYSLFRQIPAGVPGGIRLFANMLALPVARLLKRLALLQEVELFSFMSEEQLEAVGRTMTERSESDGVFLCHEGDPGTELYIVASGEVDILRERDGRVIHTAPAGTCIGEMAVLEDRPRTASMRTRGDVELLVLNGEEFQRLIHQHPNMAYRVIQLLVKRLVATMEITA